MIGSARHERRRPRRRRQRALGSRRRDVRQVREPKPGEKKRIVGASVLYGRMARPDEIGGLATFLASEDADYIVAQTYNIDGGNWMS
jgi:NAD(P)-dependent dehydrogenase (short-subunit alcohol dehydrogenase family)